MKTLRTIRLGRRVCLLIPLMTLSFTRDTPAPRKHIVKLQPVPFNRVHITDSFWAPRQEMNRTVTVPHLFEMCRRTGRLKNLELAGQRARRGYTGLVFNDSDVYKSLEAAAFVLATHPDDPIVKQVDDTIALIAKAQMPDGYLNSYYQINMPDRRWTNLRDDHELYCAGHLIEAAVAHYQATGKRTLLDVAIKFADHIDRTFGDAPGKRMGYPGHPELELALIKLWRVTGEKRYFDLARFFVDKRGSKFFAREHNTPLDRYDGRYWQDDKPLRAQSEIVGHAVRAAYLLAAATDVAAETGDEELLKALERIWRNAATRRMFITGGIGTSASNEGFTTDYDLPTRTAYQETCASIANVLWNHRMNLLTGDARYADVMERALYNGVLAGIALSGDRFFYVNPLESVGHHHRQEWFGCACCPPNIARLLASLGGYLYATSPNAVWVNLYVDSTVQVSLRGAEPKSSLPTTERKPSLRAERNSSLPAKPKSSLRAERSNLILAKGIAPSAARHDEATEFALRVQTKYPWDGAVKIAPQLKAPLQFELRLRVPGWCKQPAVKVNSKPLSKPLIERGYLVLSRTWKPGDAVELTLPMPVMKMQSHPNVKETVGHIALQRGPIVYCFEACDNAAPLRQVAIPLAARFEPKWRRDLLGGIMVLEGQGLIAEEADWTNVLYQEAIPPRAVKLMAVPYYAWDNRQPGAMKVWMPTAPPTLPILGLESRAEVTMSFVSGNCQPWGVNDGVEPRSSSEQPAALCHWWP
ncbi:MAG: glycoside hydrolase family 127 protein, partial [Abditibacteriales bacterium]|nr:glycoside hydrolase family 127 protein [Abditibacteriales bacterium]MDW8366779.1 glycoside hydrolase family 127 protein [Abditibacteriales bacterium]